MGRGLAGLCALACAAAALWMSAQHPLAPMLAVAAVILLAALAAWRPLWIPVVLLALLPVAGLAPWTGWMLAEEFDLLLLALLAGGWARLAWPAGLPPRQPATDGAAPGNTTVRRVDFAVVAPDVTPPTVSVRIGHHHATCPVSASAMPKTTEPSSQSMARRKAIAA